MEEIPFTVFEAAVRVAGSALHYKSSLAQLLRSAGVSEAGVIRHKDLTKYQIFRHIWADLEAAGQKGHKVQARIIAELANLDKADPKVPDVEAGNSAITELRRLALRANLLVSPQDLEREARRKAAADNMARATAKRDELADLLKTFQNLNSETNRQRRGYEFEKLLSSLFRWAELDYRGSFKTETDQIDGAVTLDSFTYLIEARWREEVAVGSDLAIFLDKVERRLDSTRGLFISMAGFRKTAVDQYRRARDNRLILLDGQDLAWILEARYEFSEALRAKVRAASIQGEPYVPLMDL